ncbi:MAG: InlB B-repeat-containing protein [Fibrobacter sp.]|nr:InlB B-repeat-containing protein [Fibrobacter sp.]
MKKNSYCMLVALFTLLFSNLSFAVDVDPCASWPVTLEEDADGFYEIGSADALYKFACMVNNGATNISGKLTADICLNACKEGESVLKANGTLSDNASNFTQWTPIGTSEKPYTGTFDGNGHTIRGLYVNDGDAEYVGLFGYIDESAKVQNVGVVDSYFNGSLCVGGVVGVNNGTVSNVYNTGVVSGGTFVGGVVGYNDDGTVSNVYNTGSVSGRGHHVGGVVGYSSYSTVSNVYNTGSVNGTGGSVGGVVGYSYYSTVSNVYNTGSVSGKTYVGGVVGDNDGGTVSNGFFNTAYYSGNAIGESEGTADNVKGLSMTDLANLTVGNGGDFPLLEGETESPWAKGIYYDKATGKLANSELPYLKSLPKPQDVEMEFNVKDNVIQISSTDDLKNFAKLVNEYHITDVDAELTTNLTVNSNLLGENNANVDAETGEYKGNAPANVWTPIGTSSAKYTGTFDGKGHTIRGLYFNNENTRYVGLFGYIYGSNAIVQNVGVVDSYFKGYQYVGGVVGYSAGTITNSYNMGSVNGDIVGGLVGYNTGVVMNCFNTGLVRVHSSVAGGVVGRSSGTISNVYSVGSVNGDNLPAGHAVSGGRKIGSVLGINDGGTISSAYYNEDAACINCVSTIEGTIGKIAAEFADGTVAQDLHDYYENGVDGSVWGQDLTKENSLPDFSGEIKGTLHGLTLNTFEGDDRKYPKKYVQEKGLELPTDLVRENYVFVGWYENEQFTGAQVSAIPANSSGAVEYWAKWGPKGAITLNLNGGDELAPGEGVTFYGEGKGAVLPTPMREGCLFFGWYTNEDLTGSSVSEIPSTSTGAVEYWAKWGPKSAITLNLNGGDELAPGEGVTFYGEGKGAVLPTPMREGCLFFGWYTNEDLTGSSVSEIPSTSTGAVEYWAKWGPKSAITLNLNGGDELAPGEGVTFYYEGKGAALPTPMREDYAFLGWSTKQNAESVADMVTSVAAGSTGAKEFYAQWIKVNADGCYEIASVDSLYKFAFAVNVMSNGEICGVLAENIVVNTGVLNTDGSLNTVGGDFKSWTPMNVQNGVQVTLNGAGHAIGGLYFNDGNKGEVGLFGNVEGVVSIDSLRIVDSYFKGDFYVGGLVGYSNYGTLTIENSYNAGTVSGYDYVGGLVGYVYDGTLTITNSYNAGAVSGSDSDVGGLVGYGEGTLTITNSYNAGSVSGDGDVGGLVGYGEGTLTIENSYNAGTVSGSGDVGGLVGYSNYGSTLTITNSYNAGTVSGIDNYVGGLVGSGFNLTITNSYNAGSVSGNGNDVGGLVGYGRTLIKNSFFLATGKSGDGYGGESRALYDFHNDIVAKKLHDWCEKEEGSKTCKEGGLNGSVWGQDLSNANSLPDFSGVVGHKYGSVVFFDKKVNGTFGSAEVDATSEFAVSFTENIVVSGPVKFKRTFAGSGYSTIMLPFQPNCSEGDCIKNGENVKFYEFGSYANATVRVTEVSPSALQANTPYLVQAAGVNELVFKNGGTFNTTSGDAYNSETGEYKVELGGDGAGWSIYGTYEYKSWEEGDAGLGRTYGFAANDGVNAPAIVGKFAKVGAGAYIYPMRAYLEYTAPAPAGRPAANGAKPAGNANTVASLPETINVVIVEKGETGTEIAGSDDASGEQTTRVIGTINTRTGEFKFANDRWFDLQGRYLGVKKPTQKGAYYNNGKKVIVK